MENIYGIPCNIDDKRIRTIIAKVLERIQGNFSGDWKKISFRVTGFDWLDESNPEYTNTLGLCVQIGATALSNIYFSRRIIDFDDILVTAIIGHELGHAATSIVELKSREINKNPVYAELCASRYVFKWGFVREYIIFLLAVNSDQHYGGLPGDIFAIEYPDGERRYRIGLDFKPILIRTADENGQVFKTLPIYKIPL